MNREDSVKKSHILAAEWFAEHKARLVGDVRWSVEDQPEDNMIIIDWRRPGTGNYAMRYIIARNYVIVTGDVGDAIYCFGCALTLDWILKIDWDYFIGKCVASESGRHYDMKMPGIRNPVPHHRAIGHFIGLQMAIKQLKGVQ